MFSLRTTICDVYPVIIADINVFIFLPIFKSAVVKAAECIYFFLAGHYKH